MSQQRKTGARVRPASIRDVARLAGVSHQTVSRVLNGHPSVRDATRTRVLVAMDELQFRPSRAARMLSMQRSQTIGASFHPDRRPGNFPGSDCGIGPAKRELFPADIDQ